MDFQNHDVAMKTNAELVAILKIFNGTNEITIDKLSSDVYDTDWNFRDLQLMNENIKNTEHKKLQFAQGDLQSTWSREAMDFILNEINVVHVSERFKSKTNHRMDRILLSSLQTSADVNLPGGFTRACLDRNIQTASITRYVYHTWGNCESGIIRNGICVAGRKNLRFIDKMPQLFFSPMNPRFEFVAYLCWRERMFNRTYSPERALPIESLEPHFKFYVDHPMVRFNRQRNDSSFNVGDFRCE